MRGGVGAGGVGGMIIRLVGWGGGLIGWVGRADCLGWVSDDLSFDGSKKDTLAGYKRMVLFSSNSSFCFRVSVRFVGRAQ